MAYRAPNFGGLSICLESQPGLFVGLWTDLGAFFIDTVASVRRGCFADRTVRLGSEQHGYAVKLRD